MVGVDAEGWVDDSGRSILEHRVWCRVVQSCPVDECMGPDVGAEEVLAVDGGRDIGDDGLYILFYRVLPLLIWCGALKAALVVLGGAKVCIVVTSQNSGFESAGSKESKYG